MLKATSYIQQLLRSTSINDRKVIIREAAIEGCIELFEGFKLVFDKKLIFNIKSVPYIDGDFTKDELEKESDFTWNDFLILINNIKKNTLSLNEKKKLISNAALIANIQDWNYFFRFILLKNTKEWKIDEKIINEVLLEIGNDALQYLIPIWSVQQAEFIDKKIINLKDPIFVEPCLYGNRVITILNKETNTVTMFNEYGKEVKYKNIIKKLKTFFLDIPISIVLDGIIINKNFQSLMTINTTKEKYYVLFDLIPLIDFENQICPMSQIDRHAGLMELSPLLYGNNKNFVYILPKLLIDLNISNEKEKIKEFYKETINAGYDSIIIKDINAPYECKLSKNWLILKNIDLIF